MSVLAHLRTILLVTLITAAVWVFAEAQTLRGSDVAATLLLRPAPPSTLPGESQSILTLVATREQVPDGDGFEIAIESRRPATPGLSVLLPTSDRSQALQIEGTAAMSVQLFLQGTTQSVEQVQRQLRDALDLVMGSAADLPRTEGEIEVDVARTLMRLPQFVDSGVVIQRATPAVIILRQDQLVTRNVPIVVQAPGIDVQSMPQVRPTLARVTMKRSDTEALPFSPTARVNLSPRDVEGFVPGIAKTVTAATVVAPVEIAGRSFVKVEPQTAEVTLTLRSQTAELTLQDVPVQVRMSPADMEQFDVKLAPQHRTIASVRIVGPAAAIAELQERQATSPLTATLSFRTSDLEARIDSKEVTFFDGTPGLRFEPSLVSVPVQILSKTRP